MCDQHLYRSPSVDIKLYLWSQEITITLTEDALLIFLQYGVEKLLAWLGIEPQYLRCKFSVRGT